MNVTFDHNTDSNETHDAGCDDSAGSDSPRDTPEEELDLDIQEQGDGDRLKEGFTGQER